MDEAIGRFQAGISRRHVVAGTLAAATLPLAAPAYARGIDTPATEADVGFMRIALEEAALGDDPYYFGAVIVRDGEALARGRNVWRERQDPTAHAELVAIHSFLAAHGMEAIKGTTLYATGEPCPMCMGATIWCGIARVVYGASIAELATKTGQIMISGADIAAKTAFADIELTGGVLAKESLALFK
jgi:tRNA(Arg) A34 adenosine deaminase TadA